MQVNGQPQILAVYLQGKGTWYPLKGQLDGHQSQSGPTDITMVLINARCLKHTNFKDFKV